MAFDRHFQLLQYVYVNIDFEIFAIMNKRRRGFRYSTALILCVRIIQKILSYTTYKYLQTGQSSRLNF